MPETSATRTKGKRDTWRTRSRREIDEAAVEAGKALRRARDIALQRTKEVETDDGPALAPLDVGDELDRVGYALLHVQQAENKLSFLRNLLTKRQERLETERERQIAYGDETYELFMAAEGSRKQKRLPPEALRTAIRAELTVIGGLPDTSWGRRVAYGRIGRALGVSESTVRQYAKEDINEEVAT